MEIKVHTFRLNLDWNLIGLLSKIDRFDASWSAIERKEGRSLRQLKSIATVQSVGASTRIEGSILSDLEVEYMISNLDITKLENRDSQEVAGYFDVMDSISESWEDIPLNESSIKSLHNKLMKYSQKDQWHKGDYKKLSNAVEANFPDGTRQIIFRTTEPGFPTQDAMASLIKWYKNEYSVHPLVIAALFTYDFLSIHPFQDGNGRLSRLLTSLILLQKGYKWIQFVSFEHEIEQRKNEYYKVLRGCQSQRPGEDVSAWLEFFLTCLERIGWKLMDKLGKIGLESELSPKEKSILSVVSTHPGIRSGEIARKVEVPLPTVKRILNHLVTAGHLKRFGGGAGTNYVLK
jgi:Fic family protein